MAAGEARRTYLRRHGALASRLKAYFLYVEPAGEGANEADGSFSSL